MTGRVAKALVVVPLLLLLIPLSATGQSANIEGTVVDAATQAPLGGTRISVATAQGARVQNTISDSRGRFNLDSLMPGSYSLLLSRTGFETIEGLSVHLQPAETKTLIVELTAKAFTVDPIVVSASRSQEASFAAPTAVSVVSREEIKEGIAATPLDHVRGRTGLDMAEKGLFNRTYNVRGLHTTHNSIDLKTLIDYRDVAEPFSRSQQNFVWPTANDDVERIELVRGPSSVLYGAYAQRGVLHFITRSPFHWQGNKMSLAAGERGFFNLSGRHAGLLSDRIAYKISTEYYRGNDWRFDDPVEVAQRERAIDLGADPDTLLIGARDYEVEVGRLDARIEWRPDSETTVTAASGIGHAFNVIDQAPPVGAFQLRDASSIHVQATVHHKDLFANVYAVNYPIDGGYFLRSGRPIDLSKPLWTMAAQIQHSSELASGSKLQYGLDYQHSDVAGHPSVGEAETTTTNAFGGFLYSITTLSSHIDLAAAIRLDHHDGLNDLAFSPRLAAVYKPAPSHALRVTYNRAFSPPTPSFLLPNSRLFPLGPSPFFARFAGPPKNGYTFRRDCDGLCMRSPFATDHSQYLPADATLMWDAVAALLEAQGTDISGIPAPGSSEVSTVLAKPDPVTLGFVPVAAEEVTDIPGPVRQFTQAVEAGYRGVIGDRLFVGVDIYYNRVENFVTGLAAHTPSVFFDRATLEQYLAGFVSAEEASELAGTISQIPLGTVSPREAPHPTDVLMFPRLGGEEAFWGADLTLDVSLTDHLSLTGNYSWVSIDSLTNLGPGNPGRPLNAPQNKGAVALSYRDSGTGISGQIKARAVESFSVFTGVYRGVVDGYAVVDLNVGYKLSEAPNVHVTLTALNVLDNVHQEFVGVPAVGRLIVGRMGIQF